MLNAVRLKYSEMYVDALDSFSSSPSWLSFDISTIMASPMTLMNPVEIFIADYASTACQKLETTVDNDSQARVWITENIIMYDFLLDPQISKLSVMKPNIGLKIQIPAVSESNVAS